MKNRKYGLVQKLSFTEISDVLNSLKYIKTAFLFGSRANNTQNSKSDYDFAFEMQKIENASWGMQAKAWIDICDLLDLKEYDVDIVDLSNADMYVKREIKENHILLKGDKNDISRLLE